MSQQPKASPSEDIPNTMANNILKQPEVAQPSPPPNGGCVAWMQVAGAFFLFFNSWGIVNTFGDYQTFYQQTLIPHSTPSSISWIGTIQGFLLFLVGVVVGPVFDKGYLRTLLVSGSSLVVLGLIMTSLATEYYQLFLAHGILVGVGCALLFIPSIAIVATYFTTRRAVATGITSSGGSIGSVIYPVVFRKLIEPLGFGWTTRVIAFIALAGLCFSISIMKMRLPPPKQTRKLLELSAFKELPYLLFSLGLFFSFAGLYFPFFYLPTFISKSLHGSDDLSFYSVAILNAASVFGRITPGLLADHVGSINTIIPIGLLSALMGFVWIGIYNVGGTIAFAIIYGFTSGAAVSLPPTIVARLSPNMGVVGTRMGMCFTFAGLGLLIGNPIAGTLLDVENGSFWKGQVFAAVMVTIGSLLFIAVRILKARDGSASKI